MTLWLHIGLPKTGSSALQVFFARNDRVLKERGLNFPWAGPARTGRATAGNCRWLAEAEGGWPGHMERAQQLEGWLKRGRGILLSSEQFAKADHATLRAIKEKGGDTRIIVYLRDQADMILARYLQLKGYGKIQERNFTGYSLEGAPNPHLSFGQFLEDMEGIFGAENMRVLSYKQSKSRLPASALEALGLDPEGFDMDLPPVNKSPPLETPDPDIIRQIRERFRAENERAVARWFPGQTVEQVIGP